ncbi:MAG TPA: hypothetical protein VKR52_17445 [Terracidiphilus sp.]|nr:hypothetical protein [Terracidiphilus sp.]
MASQTLVFIVLPNGITARNTLGLSLYLTPRLENGATLSQFPDFLNWPGLIQKSGLSFTLTCGSKTTTVTADATLLRPDIWQSIFTPQTYVAPYTTSGFQNRLVVSYPVADCLSYLKFLYQSIGAGRANTERGLLELMQPLVFRDGSKSTLHEARSNMRVTMWKQQHPAPGTVAVAPQNAAVSGSLPPDGTPTTLTMPANTNTAATQFALFHHIAPAPNRAPLPSTPEDFSKTLDFHSALTSLNSYPALMRSLGLIFDVEVPLSFCASSPASGAYGTIAVKSVQAGFTWSLKPAYGLPATSYQRSTTAFSAAPASTPAQVAAGQFVAGDVSDGFLNLSPDNFRLAQVDVDGAMMQALTLADNVSLNRDNPAAVGNALNALRSGGVGLIASGRGSQILQSIADNNAFNQALTGNTSFPRPLNAIDLTRGYRLDIFTTRTGKWHSLHRRNGSYSFGASGSITVQTSDEEGFLQPTAASPAEDTTRKPNQIATSAGIPQPSTDLFVHERVARWDGWSLGAPRPGAALNRSPDPGQATTPDPTLNQPVTPFKMVANYAAMPGSLPELRFGDQYRLRARAVDLSGNSLELSATTPVQNALPANGVLLPYLRFEPVLPPLVVLQNPPKAGGSLERLVIRSYNSDPSLDDAPTTDYDSRHIAPPRTSEKMAEEHGMFDNVHGHLRGDASIFNMIVARDSYEVPTSGGVQLVTQNEMQVLYLPDPLSRGAAMRALPNAPINTYGNEEGGVLSYTPLPDVQPNLDSVTFIDFGDQWPERKAFLLTLQEGSAPAEWDATNRLLHTGLAKASVAVVELSSYLTPSDLSIMAVWGWIREVFEVDENFLMTTSSADTLVPYTSDLLALLTRLVTEGGHDMITPSRTLTMVHAVQQPIGLPTFLQLPVVHQPSNPIFASALRNYFTPITAWRSQGSHAVVLLGGMQIHANSTSRIDIQGAWEEVVDDLSQPGPGSSVQSDHVETIPLAQPEAGLIYAPSSTTRAVAIYVPQVDNLWFAAPFDELEGVNNPGVVAAPLHNFNDTKHRWVTYTPTATSSFQEYFPAGLDFTRTGVPLVVDVPSSARPSPPDVVYVIPTFGWEQQETTNMKSSIRYGNSVRVYMNRPWYSSGDNEQLAAVLWPGAVTAPDYATRETYKPYFTQWGSDPIWQTGAVDLVPTIYDFPLSASTASGLVLEETSQIFDIAAHNVQYDPVRQLWFCDIGFNNSSSYMPFVRLALARYQSHSIQGVELSRVVLADFVQLSPDRSAVLSINPTNPTQARVYVGGLAPQGPETPLLTVTVEQRIPNIQTNMGWEAAPATVVTVTEDSPAPNQPDSVLWSGNIAFKSPPDQQEFRVVVREFERIRIYQSGGGARGGNEYGQRLVYAAIIPYNYPQIEKD